MSRIGDAKLKSILINKWFREALRVPIIANRFNQGQCDQIGWFIGLLATFQSLW